MKIIVLPGLDGTGLLAPEFEIALEREHSVATLLYPPELARYDDIHEWIKPHLPDEDFVLVAESFSGPLATLIGAEGLPHLKGIVFVATFARTPRKIKPFLASLFRFLPLKSAPLVHLALPFLMGKWTNPTFSDRFRQVLASSSTSTFSKRLTEVLKVDVRHDLQTISIPILYLRATNDWLVPAHMSRDFTAASGIVQHVEGPHFLLQAKADQVVMIVANFVESLKRR